MPTPRPLVLLSLDWRRPKDPRTSLGHASLLARLSTVRDLVVHPVQHAVNDPAFDLEALFGTVLATLLCNHADLAIGVYVWNESVVANLLRMLRSAGYTGRIILGGPQISYAPAGVASLYPEADVLIRGYGEDALAAVVMAPSPTAIPGVVWRGEADAGQVATVALEDLPSPILSGTLPVQPFMRWETQRGCIYSCSFCQHREAGARLARHTLASRRVAAEVEALVAGGAVDIAVLDPIFQTNPDAEAILRRFAYLGYSGRLSLQARFELLNDRFLDACADLDVRLEFGLQTTQRSEMRAVRRINRLDRVDAAIHALHRRRISFEVSLIYGLPTQTLESFQASVAWCQERGVPVVRAFPLMLLRGTALDRQREIWGLQEGPGPIPVVVQSNSFSRQDWREMQSIATGLATESGIREAA